MRIYCFFLWAGHCASSKIYYFKLKFSQIGWRSSPALLAMRGLVVRCAYFYALQQLHHCGAQYFALQAQVYNVSILPAKLILRAAAVHLLYNL